VKAGRWCPAGAAVGRHMPEIQSRMPEIPDELQEPDMVTDVTVFDPGVEGQQIELIYTQAATAISAAFILACLVAGGLWSVADQSYLTMWLVAQTVQTLLRLGLVLRYRNASEQEKQSSRWMVLFFSGTLVAGIVWGSIGLIFSFSWPVEHQTFTLLSLAGIVSGAISSYAAMMSVYIAFMVPCILIPAQSMLSYSSSLQANLGLILMLFAGVLIVIARNYNKSVIRSLQLRLENQTLLASMRSANRKLQDEITVRETMQKSLISEQQLFTNGPVTVFRVVADRGWPLDYISGTVSQFGYNAEELVSEHRSYGDLIYPDDLRRVEKAWSYTGATGTRSMGIDYRIRCNDGRVRWVYDYSVPIRNDRGEITHYSGYILDISERKSSEYELQQEKERAELTLHSIAEAVITTDVNGQIEYLSPRAEELTGWDREMARGLPVARVFSLFDDDSQTFIQEAVSQCLQTDETMTPNRDTLLSRNDGQQYTIRYSASPIMSNADTPLGVILVFHDLTDTRNMERELSYVATHDALTGLLNRSEFELHLNHAIGYAGKSGDAHVLMHIDIDQLKIVNDTGSHEAGDELLRQFSTMLKECLRESDDIARLGGDEFGALLRNCSIESASQLAEKILESVKSLRFSNEERVFEISSSIGMTLINEHSRRATHAMSEADLACQAAKEMGGNRFQIYTSSDEELMRRQDEMQWVSRISEAILEDRLVLYGQLIAPVKPVDGGGLHFEVLVRMKNDQGELVMPSRFLPAAERYNLITGIDRWVVSHSFTWYAEHCGTGDGESLDMMSINLSGSSVCDPAIQQHIKTAMQKYGVPPQSVCFEITETAAISNLAAASDFINELRKLGCRFALDDFGSGLSSFGYLKNLPVDYLKIDGTFVRDMDTDDVNHAMVSAIQQLGRIIGIKTIAEFVESDSILEMLAELGVDYAQGYAIAMPKPLTEFEIGARRLA
jgi:diguanylate cyclase (GGDEF)-like protein/PAS domain S-box-containing protein